MSFEVLIPARYASTRLPGKMLKVLAGQPMIRHVVARALDSGASAVHVATDDARIAEAVAGSGASVVMTRDDHQSGTERLAEACRKLGLDAATVVVNVQGDEPLIPARLIDQCAQLLRAHPNAAMATLCHAIEALDELLDPNIVKVVFDVDSRALWFSRSPIPYERGGFERDFGRRGHAAHWRHIGIYAYRVGALEDYVALPPAAAECSESLEQLRLLHHGRDVVVTPALEAPGPGVDTEHDFERVCAMLARECP